MEFLQDFDINNVTYFTVQLIVALAALGFLVFSLFVSRQVQLMNRVLTTRLAGTFQLIGFLFVLGSGAILVFSVLALLA